MFLTALCITSIVLWLGGAVACVAIESRNPFVTATVPPFVAVAGVVSVLWLIFG